MPINLISNGKLFDKGINFTFVDHQNRDVAQPGSALRSGRRGRWFESSHPDTCEK